MRTLDWARLRQLELVIEVLSPTTARADRFTKRWLYQEMRVAAYWIVEADQIEWRPVAAAEPCVLAMQDLFRPV